MLSTGIQLYRGEGVAPTGHLSVVTKGNGLLDCFTLFAMTDEMSLRGHASGRGNPEMFEKTSPGAPGSL